MIIGIILTILGMAYFAARLQLFNVHLNPRHKQQYALVLDVLKELAAKHGARV
jgi:hypothetical protein